MITSIEIENLRGIRTGKLEGLTPLTILTGPNACGKSTVLDGLLIGASPTPGDAVGHAVERHPVVRDGSRWLFGDPSAPATVLVGNTFGGRWSCELKWAEGGSDLLARLRRRNEESRPPFSTISFTRTDTTSHGDDETSQMKRAPHVVNVKIAFDADNRFLAMESGGGSEGPASFVRLIDPGLPVPLHRTFTEVSRIAGRRNAVDEILLSLVPEFEQLEILVEKDDKPSLNIRSAGRSVPVGLAGDGIQAFVQLALEIAIAPEGLALLEEPEVYQHPKAIWQSAKVLLVNMRRGVQTVLTTHSLELIDALIAEASADDLEKMSVFNLLLEDGKLSSGRRAGEEIAFARQTLENDLR